ncbi:MAG: zinc ribbon domain-containing protein [Firmicutes bacterium]|nr:zinc ribbon domain-containing protein [Bacillota bacterium]
MIDKVAGIMAKRMSMPAAQATEVAKTFIPRLKRWQESRNQGAGRKLITRRC